MQAQQAAQCSSAPNEAPDTGEELTALRARTADLEMQLGQAEARCEQLQRSLSAAEGQLTSTKVAATQATLTAQVCYD